MKTHEYLKHTGKSSLDHVTFQDLEAMKAGAPSGEPTGPTPDAVTTTAPAAKKRPSAKKSRR